MKVVYIIDTLNGYGAEKSIVQIAIGLNKITPVVIQLFAGDYLLKLLELNSIKVYSLNLENESNHRLEQIISIIAVEKPDIIHSTLFRSDMLARKLKKLFPSIILVGSFVSNSYSKNRFKQLSFVSSLKLRSTQIRDRITMINVDYFISNSQAIKDSNIKALGVKGDIVDVIYRGRGIDNKQQNIETIKQIKNDLGIGQNIKVFLNVARLSKGKGQIELIKAFKNLSDKESDVILLLAGEGKLKGELRELILSLNLENDVILLGYRNDVSNLLEIADYFIFPSFFEGLSGALIEAILSKTPCIISNIPENMECFPENTSLNFKLGNIEDLSLKMEEALTLKNWNQKTNLAYAYALQNFDINKVCEKYDRFYERIIIEKSI
ncbi:Glycosyltransferase involved in cell wall bisynthesis [Gillisia sp. Hel1_33_143]|uniref:glycosyltransferase n=1 Tax=Gillisia sp. Hel1_33_143 TaxID=1336796 RepID=UPI00087A47C9|nr:glycosyltransferase [Gillisia sp. Hel1_33_143]SDS79310.1 Glycosyltransferase involved in cell wall bisynthesis [Gillisia sp. Hel1_33_143]